MAITGSIYSLVKKETDLTTKQVFENMMSISRDRGAVVIDGRSLAAGSIFAEQIHADAITADKIKAGEIQTEHMVAGSIDVDRLKANQLILPGETYGGVKINNEGISMKSTGLNVTLSSKSGFNITDKGGNQLIDIDPLTGNVIMQINEMIIGGYNAATQEDVEERVKNIELTPGPTGTSGQGVTSITEEYYLSTSKESQTGGVWKAIPDPWKPGRYQWTRSKIVYTNPTKTGYTDPVIDTSWEAIDGIEIGTRNLLRDSNVEFSFGEDDNKYIWDVYRDNTWEVLGD